MDRAHAPSRQRGTGLAEILVALVLFVTAVVIALEHYEAARRTLETGSARAELQQALRAGLGEITRVVRAAGLGVHPDGDPGRPDEGIEAALERAIVVRADFDGGTGGPGDPETALALGGAFVNVTTGNDEIVGFVLARAADSDPGEVRFDADVAGVPRDGRVETVAISDVALSHDEPPYTLYRVSVKPDSTRCVRVPVIDGVRSLRFEYFDAAGRPILPPGGSDDPAARRARERIRRIRVEIEGMTRKPIPGWLDPRDRDPATRPHRKFRLSGDLAPRNLGLVGSADAWPAGSP